MQILPIPNTEFTPELAPLEILRQEIQNLLWTEVKSTTRCNAASIVYAKKETQEIISCISVDYVESETGPNGEKEIW